MDQTQLIVDHGLVCPSANVAQQWNVRNYIFKTSTSLKVSRKIDALTIFNNVL